MKIGDVMRRFPHTIQETDTLGAAQRAMARHHVRHLPVIGGGKLVGLLSERDVLAQRARSGADEDWWRLEIRAVMTTPPMTANPDDSLSEAASRMAATKIGALPVVERGKLVGIATVSDVLDGEVRAAMAPPAASAIAADAMTPWPETVAFDAPIHDAIRVMADRQVRHVPVIDAASTIVGMLSERDIRTAVGDPLRYIELRNRSESRLRVCDVMTEPAVSVTFDRPLVELARMFADQRLSAVPVVDAFGALIGIVSYVDLLRILAA
jgi:acetoin utilization protein AcuB